jgi:hypothetical protein
VSRARAEPVALAVSAAFTRGQLDFSFRPAAPTPGWAAMPECVAAERVLAVGSSDAATRSKQRRRSAQVGRCSRDRPGSR